MPSSQDDIQGFVDDYLPALLAQASRLISGEFHEAARAEGYSVSEWRVMATLASYESMSIGRLAQISVTKQPTVTRLLDRMQDKGLVERVPHGSDRRITLVRMTPAGRADLARLIKLAREHEQRVLDPFNLASAESLKSVLRELIAQHRREGAPVEEDD